MSGWNITHGIAAAFGLLFSADLLFEVFFGSPRTECVASGSNMSASKAILMFLCFASIVISALRSFWREQR